MRALVLADTHLGAGQADRLLRVLGDRVRTPSVILHAGDITHPSVLESLAEFAPVHAVLGNNDRGVRLPERVEVEIAGCSIALVHDSGPAGGRGPRLHRCFPSADVVVFGHSHLPWNQVDVGADGHVQHHVNPGSALVRRRAPRRTIAWLELLAGEVVSIEHEPVD